MKSRGGAEKQKKEEKNKQITKEKALEERKSRCVKRQENRDRLYFSNNLWLRGVEKQAR